MSKEEAALSATNNLTELLKGEPNVLSIDFDYEDPSVLKIRVEDLKAQEKLRGRVQAQVEGVSSAGDAYTFQVEVVIGPKILPAIADTSVKSISPRLAPAQGGDRLSTLNSSTWGTAGVFFAGIQIEASHLPNTKYVCSGTHVVLSNNHVIGGLDTVPFGTVIVADPAPQQRGVLGCIFPVKDILVHMDFALGINFPAAGYTHGALRNLGQVNPVIRNPADNGEPIRKLGARSGVTSGVTIGRTSIRAPGWNGDRWYQGVYKTSPDFLHHGDSGSIVIGGNNDLVGMATWVEDPDTPSAHGYFYTFGTQWPFRARCKIDIRDIA